MPKWLISLTFLIATFQLQCFAHAFNYESVLSQPDYSGGSPNLGKGQKQAFYPNTNFNPDNEFGSSIADEAEQSLPYKPGNSFSQWDDKDNGGYQLPLKDSFLKDPKLHDYGSGLMGENGQSCNSVQSSGSLLSSSPGLSPEESNESFLKRNFPTLFKEEEYPGKDLEPMNRPYPYSSLDDFAGFPYKRKERQQCKSTTEASSCQKPKEKPQDECGGMKTTTPSPDCKPKTTAKPECKPPKPKPDDDLKCKTEPPATERNLENQTKCPSQIAMPLTPSPSKTLAASVLVATTSPPQTMQQGMPNSLSSASSKAKENPKSEESKSKLKLNLHKKPTQPLPSQLEQIYKTLAFDCLKKQGQSQASGVGSSDSRMPWKSDYQSAEPGKPAKFHMTIPLDSMKPSQSFQKKTQNQNLNQKTQSEQQSKILFGQDADSNKKNDGSPKIDITIEVGSRESLDRWIKLLHKIKRHAICAISNANDFEIKMLSAERGGSIDALDMASIRDELSELLSKSDPPNPEEAPSPAAFLLPNQKKDDHVVKDNQRRLYFKQLELDTLKQHEKELRDRKREEELRLHNQLAEENKFKENLQKAMALKQGETKCKADQCHWKKLQKQMKHQGLQEKIRQELREKGEKWQKLQYLKMLQEQKDLPKVMQQQKEQKEILKEQHETLRLLEKLNDKEHEVENWQLQEKLQQKEDEIKKLKQEKQQEEDRRNSVELQLELIPNELKKYAKCQQQQQQHLCKTPEQLQLMNQQQLQKQLQAQLIRQEILQKELLQRQKQQEKLHEELLKNHQKQVKMHQEAELRHQQLLKMRQEQIDKWDKVGSWQPPKPKIGRLQLHKTGRLSQQQQQQEMKKFQEQEKDQQKQKDQLDEKEEKEEQDDGTNYFEQLRIADKILREKLQQEKEKANLKLAKSSSSSSSTKSQMPKDKWQKSDQQMSPYECKYPKEQHRGRERERDRDQQSPTLKYPSLVAVERKNDGKENKNSKDKDQKDKKHGKNNYYYNNFKKPQRCRPYQKSKWLEQVQGRLEQLQQGKLKVFLDMNEWKEKLEQKQQKDQDEDLDQKVFNNHHNQYFPQPIN